MRTSSEAPGSPVSAERRAVHRDAVALEQDRERVGIVLLGHPADQVRVGRIVAGSRARVAVQRRASMRVSDAPLLLNIRPFSPAGFNSNS